MAETDFTKYANKTVILTVKEGDSTVKKEGRIEAASDIGVAFKPKGTTQIGMIEGSTITNVEVLPEKPKVIKPKALAPCTLENVRQHLVDRHGLNLEWINKTTPEAAMEYHNDIDHAKDGVTLSHFHKEPESDESADEQSKELDEALSGSES